MIGFNEKSDTMTTSHNIKYHPKEVDPVKKFEINIDKPKYDQDTYMGRALHFFTITNPWNLFTSRRELHRCACIVKKYRNHERLPPCITVHQLWKCKHLYDSAFHPETGELMPLLGRMSAQVPINALIIGGMMVYYKGMFNLIFWQWLNQTSNSFVTNTNRSGITAPTTKQLITSYVFATTGAIATALTLSNMAQNAPPVAARMVPFCAVAVGNMINVPFIRAQELKDGILVSDSKDRPLGYSKIAAQKAIAATIISRIFMAMPGMLLTPFIMNHLERRGTLCRYPWMIIPTQCGLLALCLTFATPLCCALFKQRPEIYVSRLETHLQESFKCMKNPPKTVYYNRGL